MLSSETGEPTSSRIAKSSIAASAVCPSIVGAAVPAQRRARLGQRLGAAARLHVRLDLTERQVAAQRIVAVGRRADRGDRFVGATGGAQLLGETEAQHPPHVVRQVGGQRRLQDRDRRAPVLGVGAGVGVGRDGARQDQLREILGRERARRRHACPR